MTELTRRQGIILVLGGGASGMGLAMGGMMAGMLYGSPVLGGLSLAAGWSGFNYFLPLKDDQEVIDQIKESIQNWKKPSRNKLNFLLAGLAGYGISAAAIHLNQGSVEYQQQFAAEQAEIRKLPALDPHAPIQISETPFKLFCTPADKAVGASIAVNHNGQRYSLNCSLD